MSRHFMEGDYYIHDWTKTRVPSVRVVLCQQAFNQSSKADALRCLRAHLQRVLWAVDEDIKSEEG